MKSAEGEIGDPHLAAIDHIVVAVLCARWCEYWPQSRSTAVFGHANAAEPIAA